MESKIRPNKFIDEEIKVDKNLTVVSKTDSYGTILYVNQVFEEISEYNKLELIGEPHNVVRHPSMPKVIFKMLWENLKNKNNFHAIIKNITKSGRYYWVITDFTIEEDDKGKTTGYISRRKAIPESVSKKISALYQDLLDIERIKGEKACEYYFEAYLKEEIGKNYNDFVVDLFNEESFKLENNKHKAKAKIKKGLNWFFFGDTF